jgi:hypothetical protein
MRARPAASSRSLLPQRKDVLKSALGPKMEVFLLARHVRRTLDIVAKVFLGWRTKILGAADAFYAGRREGPYRFIKIDHRPP